MSANYNYVSGYDKHCCHNQRSIGAVAGFADSFPFFG